MEPSNRIRISCLPVAGIDNPYQQLMMNGLNESGRLHAFNGVDDRFFGILRTAFRDRPDFIHFDWIVSYYYRRWKWLTWLSIVSFYCQIWFITKILDLKLVWTLHNITPHDLDQTRIHLFCQRFLAKNCSWIRIFSRQSLEAAARILQQPERKFRIVPEGSYVNFYPKEAERTSARALLNILPEKKVLLYFGYIKPYKGILELITAFEKVCSIDSLLIIAGKMMDLNYGQLVAKSIGNQVILVDKFISETDIQNYFAACDIVVLPFKKIENSGSVILAMGFKKPVIAPRSGAVAERLENQTDLLFDDPVELAGKMEYALNMSAEKLEDIGLKNMTALKKYNWTDFQNLFK